MSDLEYKNKYLKYKIKYINLRNELELQDGGSEDSVKDSGKKFFGALGNKIIKGVKATGQVVAKGVKIITDKGFWSGHKIVFFLSRLLSLNN